MRCRPAILAALVLGCAAAPSAAPPRGPAEAPVATEATVDAVRYAPEAMTAEAPMPATVALQAAAAPAAAVRGGGGAAVPGFLATDRSVQDGGFVIEIHRRYADAFEADLIRRAEAEAAGWSVDGSEPPEAGGWSWREFDGVDIPWAVTGQALAYYVETIETFRAGDFSRTFGIEMTQASLKYEASVEWHERLEADGRVFERVRVVRMRLGWFQYCGSECAMGFAKDRLVVFDEAGSVVAVLLDGPTDYIVS